MKKISLTSILLLLMFSLLLPISLFADDEISLVINDVNIEMDVPPIIQNGRTLIPIRTLEKMNFNVFWDDTNKKVKVSKHNDFIELQINNNEVIKSTNGLTETLTLDTPPIIYNNRTMVPVRFISETMGYVVDWNGKTRTVLIKTDNLSQDENKINPTKINDFINAGLLNKNITLITKIGDTKNIQEIKNNGNRVDSFLYKKDVLTTSMECEINRGICTIDFDGKKEATVIDKKTSEELKSTKQTIEKTIKNIENILNEKNYESSIYNGKSFKFLTDNSIELTLYTDESANVIKLVQTKYLNDKKTDFSELIFEN